MTSVVEPHYLRTTMALTIAIAYGGRDEITDAVRALLREVANEGKPLAEAIEASLRRRSPAISTWSACPIPT